MHTDTANLRQDQEAVIQPGAVAVLLEGERAEAIASLEAGEPRLVSPLDAPEERLIGLVQPREHVLQDVRVDGRVLRKLRAYLLQFHFASKARDGGAAPLPCRDALL
jgi:hypothetical protein